MQHRVQKPYKAKCAKTVIVPPLIKVFTGVFLIRQNDFTHFRKKNKLLCF